MEATFGKCYATSKKCESLKVEYSFVVLVKLNRLVASASYRGYNSFYI